MTTPAPDVTPAPIASQEIISAITCTVAGLEDPRSGKVAIGMQLVLPPLTPGGLAYAQAMTPYLKRLGPAVVRGEVIILSTEFVAGALDALNAVGIIPQAGWIEETIAGQLLLLHKILQGTLTVAELGEIVGEGARPSALEVIHALRDRETAANHLRNALQLLTKALDVPEREALIAAALRIHQARMQLEPGKELETRDPSRPFGSSIRGHSWHCPHCDAEMFHAKDCASGEHGRIDFNVTPPMWIDAPDVETREQLEGRVL